jgi:hypothetical protein
LAAVLYLFKSLPTIGSIDNPGNSGKDSGCNYFSRELLLLFLAD